MEITIYIKYTDRKTREKVKLWAPDTESMDLMCERYIRRLCDDETVVSFEIVKGSV